MKTRLACTLLIIIASGQCLSQPINPSPANTRQDEIRQKGEDVMPFALDKTIHVFDKTATGGVQRVRVRGDSPEQLAMIRAHLRDIAQAFGARDFSKPTHIHGAGMPGLAQMQAAKPGQLSVDYAEFADGGQITYVGHTPEIVAAIHRWFDAQLRDHGDDATTGNVEPPKSP